MPAARDVGSVPNIHGQRLRNGQSRNLSLTPVRADLVGLAGQAVDFLLSSVSTASSRVEFRVETERIVQGSSGPPPPVTG